jgi:hypothetical protein
MKMTEYEKQLMQQRIQTAMQTIDQDTGKPLISFKDAFMVEQIDNFKLAYNFLANTIADNERKAEMGRQQREQANADAQQQTAAQSADAEKQMQADKNEAEKDLLDFKSTKDKELKALEIAGMVAAKGLPLPDFMQAMISQLVPNITIPLAQENKQMAQAIQAQAAAEQQQAIQEQAMQQQGQQPGQPQQQDMQPQQGNPQMQNQQQPQMAMA